MAISDNWTLAAMIQWVRRLLNVAVDDTDYFTDEMIVGFFNDLKYYVNLLKTKADIGQTQTDVNLTEDTMFYTIASGVDFTDISEVYKLNSSDEYELFPRKSYQEMVANDNNWENADSGEIAFWFPSPTLNLYESKIGVYPPPDADKTGGLRIVHAPVVTVFTTSSMTTQYSDLAVPWQWIYIYYGAAKCSEVDNNSDNYAKYMNNYEKKKLELRIALSIPLNKPMTFQQTKIDY